MCYTNRLHAEHIKRLRPERQRSHGSGVAGLEQVAVELSVGTSRVVGDEGEL